MLDKGFWRISNKMISPERIYIVIPVHNRKQYTLNCLASLQRQTVSGFHIVVVDDGSTDGTSDAVAKAYPEATVIRGDGNLWWSGAMNAGVKHALKIGSDYIISLNNDLEVAENYIEKMIYWACRKPEALFGSYSFDIETRKPVFGGCRIVWETGKVISLVKTLPSEQRNGLHEVTHFSGRGLWIPAQVFRRIGFFDDKHLPLYAADDDFTLRARKKGYEVYCNFDARLYSHIEAAANFENRKSYSLKGCFNHLFGIKGAGNVKNATIIAFRHCPKKYLPYYWLRMMAGQIAGYLRDWIKYSRLRRGK